MYVGKLYYDSVAQRISLANAFRKKIWRATYRANIDGWIVETLDGQLWETLHVVKSMSEAIVELFGYAKAMNVPMGIPVG